MIIHDKPPLDEALLVHYGVKGMHWGIRKERTPAEKRALAKKVAIGTGALLVVAGAAAVGYQLHKKKQVSLKDITNTASKGKSIVDSILQEQTDVIHATRGHSKGFRFLKTGGFPDPLSTYEKAFGANNGRVGTFSKLSDGKIAASFLDPNGKMDFAGRRIPHEIIIPKSMADGIHNLEDVQSKIWPLISDQYESFYESSKGAFK